MYRNKLFIILLIVVIAITGFFIIKNIQNNLTQEPQISLSEEEWNFGRLREDEKSEHIFIIRNTGGKELIIDRVRAACGCTATMLSDDHILPGKSAELKTTFNPRGYDGNVKKSIYIESNDPENPRVRLDIIADVETIPAPRAFLSNSNWNFELISRGDFPKFNFSIENKGELELIIEKIDASDYIRNSVDIPLIIPPAEKKEIVFTYDSSEHNIGEVKESIRIYCNDPRRKAFSLRVSGYIKEEDEPKVSIYPTIAEFELSNVSDSKIVKQFILENTGNKSIKIISVATSSDYLVPLLTEIDLKSNQQENLQLMLLKESIKDNKVLENSDDFLYLTLAIPIKIIE